MDTRTPAPIQRPRHATPPGNIRCIVIGSPSESFDGADELHFYAIPDRPGAGIADAVAEKVVPAGTEPDSVAWELNPEVLEC